MIEEDPIVTDDDTPDPEDSTDDPVKTPATEPDLDENDTRTPEDV
jgi:hypothetical protein